MPAPIDDQLSKWASNEKALVQQKILRDSGLGIDSVDTAYDFCLTCLESRFPKRDTFIATSDLARSLWLLCLLGLIPIVQGAIISFGGMETSHSRFWRSNVSRWNLRLSCLGAYGSFPLLKRRDGFPGLYGSGPAVQ